MVTVALAGLISISISLSSSIMVTVALAGLISIRISLAEGEFATFQLPSPTIRPSPMPPAFPDTLIRILDADCKF